MTNSAVQNSAIQHPIIWTVGHSNVPIGQLLVLLESANIQTVVDCRSKPRSRWPQYNADRFESYLAKADVAYEFRGRNIGGLDGNMRFAETLDELVDRANSSERLVLLCSEGDYRKCHRYTTLTPALEGRGVNMVHLTHTKPQRGLI